MKRFAAALAMLAALLLGGCAAVSSAPPIVMPGDASLHWQDRGPALAHLQYSPVPDSVVHALRIDLAAPGIRVQVSPSAERNKTLADMPSSAGALAAVNASFFSKTHDPRGLTVSEGEAWPEIMQPQASPLLACDDKPRCTIQLQPPFELKPGWRNVVAGTPWLLDHGRVRTATDDETCKGLCAMTHPRTAVGLDASGRYLFLVVCEGRRPPVLGLTLAQLSAVMQQLGADMAVNLDGGGSSTMLVLGESVLARPFNEPQLRKVANALQVFLNVAR